MEIKVADLRKNPFRDFSNYPINREKVKILKEKIEKSHFWAGIEARPASKGTYEIAFGHHRLKAARKLGIKKADITVREIEDGEMLYMMLSENAPAWKPDTAAITGMVLAAKKALDAELLKAETWEDWQNMANKFMSHIFKNAKSFKNSQRTGAGAPVILKYLGKGWNQETIQQALGILNDKEINQSALEKSFPKLGHANAFRKVYESSGVSLDDQDQEKFIEKVNHDLGNKKTAESIKKLAKEVLKEIRIETEPIEVEEGKINRVALLKALKLLKPALAKKDILEAMTCYYFDEDRIISYNDWMWTSVPFPTGFTGLLKAVALETRLIISKDILLEFSPSEDSKNLLIKGDATNLQMPILLDQEYCKRITARIPEGGKWHEIPDGLFDGLSFGAKYASDDFVKTDENSIYLGDYVSDEFDTIEENSIYVKGDNIFSSEFITSIYQLKNKVACDFSIPKFQVKEILSYYRNAPLLSSYRVEPLEKEEGLGFTDIVHFRGDDITVSVKSRGMSRFPVFFEVLFGDEKDYRVELPEEMNQTLDGFDRLLKESFEISDDRMVILKFSEGEIICVPGSKEEERARERFFIEHGMEDQEIVVRLASLREVLKKTKRLINIDGEKNLMEFGDDVFRLAIPMTRRN